jgi:exodeoxyribonuclease VII large subunit
VNLLSFDSDDVPAEPVTWTVTEVTQHAGLAVAATFPGLIWVEGEITNYSKSNRGHVYFSLVDPDGDRRAQLPVTLFDWNRQKVNLQIRRAGGGIRIDNGVRVRIRGNVELYAARSQVQLRMVAIDPTYTLGALAAARDALLATLAEEGLLEANRSHLVPILPLRVALITSLRSAAHADFLHEIRASGIGFTVWEIDARVQGDEAPPTVSAAIQTALTHCETELDLICIVRGGGAQTELATFDHELIARSIASCPVPVWVGIGHETDRTIADEVAHRSFKTPTACAAGLVEVARSGIERVEQAGRALCAAASTRLALASAALERRSGTIALISRRGLDRNSSGLDRRSERLISSARERQSTARHRLEAAEARVGAYDPARVMARGWTMTRTHDGRLLRSVAQVQAGDRIVTSLVDGNVTSTVEAVDVARDASTP